MATRKEVMVMFSMHVALILAFTADPTVSLAADDTSAVDGARDSCNLGDDSPDIYPVVTCYVWCNGELRDVTDINTRPGRDEERRCQQWAAGTCGDDEWSSWCLGR